MSILRDGTINNFMPLNMMKKVNGMLGLCTEEYSRLKSNVTQ